MSKYQTYAMSDYEKEKYLKLCKYLDSLLLLPRIQAIWELPPPITVLIVDTCGYNIAGRTWIYPKTESYIELSAWILYDIEQAKLTVRHELAHIVKSYCELDGASHGRGYNKALRIVSAHSWRKDKHWTSNVVIDTARRRRHPRIKIKVTPKSS